MMDDLDSKMQNELASALLETRRIRDIPGYAYELGMTVGGLVKWLRSINGPVVDLGSGDGNFGKQLKKIAPSVKLLGLDLLPSRFSVNNTFGNFQRLPIRTGSIPAALCVCSLGYYANTEDELLQSLNEVTRILDSGGLLKMCLNPTPGIGPVDGLFAVEGEVKKGDYEKYINYEYTVNRYDRTSDNLKFKIIEYLITVCKLKLKRIYIKDDNEIVCDFQK